eukprot:tig00021123_g18522.t1
MYSASRSPRPDESRFAKMAQDGAKLYITNRPDRIRRRLPQAPGRTPQRHASFAQTRFVSHRAQADARSCAIKLKRHASLTATVPAGCVGSFGREPLFVVPARARGIPPLEPAAAQGQAGDLAALPAAPPAVLLGSSGPRSAAPAPGPLGRPVAPRPLRRAALFRLLRRVLAAAGPGPGPGPRVQTQAAAVPDGMAATAGRCGLRRLGP